MIRHFRTFSAIFVTAILAAPVAIAGQTPAAPAAPAAPARGPAGPPAPCGPGVTGKNIASDSRCFELRTYTVKGEGPGSIDLLHSRFREVTNRLFRKHGMTIVGFWQPTNAGMENTLIYVLAYKDRAARDAAWEAFRTDPEWMKTVKEMQVGTSVQSVFMNSTDYGPMK
jgi:NIPSNAP